MIEISFAIVLGFGVISVLCGLFDDDSHNVDVLFRALIFLILLSFIIGIAHGGSHNLRSHIARIIGESFVDRTVWILLGGGLAIAAQLITEGHIHEVWLRLHPQSAPTPEAQMGQRANVTGKRDEHIPGTLVGTSTKYLKTELDLRTETLVRLCYSAFEDCGPLMMSRLEAELRLGTGHRQKAFHKIVAGSQGRRSSKRIVHRYWRSVNGSTRMAQGLLGELYRLAKVTDNRDKATMKRIAQVGEQLSLTQEEMGRALKGKL